VTWSRSSSADAKHSDCPLTQGFLRNLGDIGEDEADSRDKKEFEGNLLPCVGSTLRKSREAGVSTAVLELPSSVSMKEKS
jgi:hypothetical protein